MVNFGIWFQIFTKRVQFFINFLSVLLVVFLNILFLVQRELDIYKLLDVIFVNDFGTEELNPWYPVVSFILGHATKIDQSSSLFQLALLLVFSRTNIKVISILTHEGICCLVNVLNLDDPQWLAFVLILVPIMVPGDLFAGHNHQSFRHFFVCFLPLFEEPSGM